MNYVMKNRLSFLSTTIFFMIVMMFASGVVFANNPVSLVSPFSWKPSKEHLCIDTDEAREVYTRIINGDYFEIEELKNHNIVKQLDVISDYYKNKYGDTSKIKTPERQELRKKIIQDFLAIGSARLTQAQLAGATTGAEKATTTGVKGGVPTGKYVFDGPLKKEFKLELILGLPASGKSTAFVNPHSDILDAFILDCDVIKELLPEFQETFGGAADAVHFESFALMDEAMKEFLEGGLKGTNIIIPIVAPNFDELMEKYIQPFEHAGYDVRAVFVGTPEKICMNWNVKRQLDSGRIFTSKVAFSFGDKPREVYERLKVMTNSKGKPYGEKFEETAEEVEEEEVKEAA